ncbi:MAG: hypothetical protein IPM77_09200 [Crocinitomicaceae bacterium]|nr:hypothetical protein [Crocinitomicaceae bacterium]
MRKKIIYTIWVFVLTAGCATSPKDDSSTRFNVTENQNTEVRDSAVNTNVTSSNEVGSEYTIDNMTLSEEEKKLYVLLTGYRQMNELEKIPLSRSLTYVAQMHCMDLENNAPDKNTCNAHSWSESEKWTGCCYTPDHKMSNCMWSKPGEMTPYQGYGFEIACGSSDDLYKSFVMTAEYALHAWKESTGHNNVILNKENWENLTWNAVGVGIYKGFACVWFGRETDPAGEIKID